MASVDGYDAVIGLEVHVQLGTESKMFTDAPYYFGASPNELTNPVVMGMPGTLPVLNKRAIEKTIQVGLMLGCEIPQVSKWDRKHYYYPDMPKNYQISQYDQPLCLGGSVEIELDGPSRNVMGEHRRVSLTRIHLEEDVGKLTHVADGSLVDYNRAGAPLIEIVTEPDIFSPEEAFAFLTSLRNTLQNAGISDCDMEKGQMRCDANVSVKPVGTTKLGTKVELKNLNSISGVRNGLRYEIDRQIRELKAGATIVQQTRRWDAEAGVTSLMRTKEEAQDYRYFPDPDLMPVRISEDWKSQLAEGLPELPFDRQRRYMADYSLPYTVTSVLCSNRQLSVFFEEAIRQHNNPLAIANLITNDLLRELGAASSGSEVEDGERRSLDSLGVSAVGVADLVAMVDKGVLSNQMAKEVLSGMIATGQSAEAVAEAKGLRQSSDSGEIEAICRQAMEENPKAVQEFLAGNEKSINAIKGRVMKATQGKANPTLVDQVLRKLLASG
ncbi:MAG: Asp-tRNA(Asn)/Glu-tRNA(Gln) amidotransferase subunit GatB [Opitutales bacterium]|nr:Asp-tRNA(Asn)/Glu-tRNA(Gln) amidotransferase subunit GatB [Opitutales bacterium]